MRSRQGAARTILLAHIISARPSKQPLMVRTFPKVYMELDFYFLFLQEQIKDIIIILEFLQHLSFYRHSLLGHPDIVSASIPEDFRRAIPDNADNRRGL